MSRAEAHLDLQDALAQADADDLAGAAPNVANVGDGEPASDQAEQAEQQALAAELAQSRQVLAALDGDLRAIDGELESFATEREQHRLLLDLCSSLDKLGDIGGASLFWGEGADKQANAEHVHRVRVRVEQFNERMAVIEGRRQAVIDRIKQQEGHAAFMEDVLFELPDLPEKHIRFDAAEVRERLSRILNDDDLRRYIL